MTQKLNNLAKRQAIALSSFNPSDAQLIMDDLTDHNYLSGYYPITMQERMAMVRDATANCGLSVVETEIAICFAVRFKDTNKVIKFIDDNNLLRVFTFAPAIKEFFYRYVVNSDRTRGQFHGRCSILDLLLYNPMISSGMWKIMVPMNLQAYDTVKHEPWLIMMHLVPDLKNDLVKHFVDLLEDMNWGSNSSNLNYFNTFKMFQVKFETCYTSITRSYPLNTVTLNTWMEQHVDWMAPAF